MVWPVLNIDGSICKEQEVKLKAAQRARESKENVNSIVMISVIYPIAIERIYSANTPALG